MRRAATTRSPPRWDARYSAVRARKRLGVAVRGGGETPPPNVPPITPEQQFAAVLPHSRAGPGLASHDRRRARTQSPNPASGRSWLVRSSQLALNDVERRARADLAITVETPRHSDIRGGI